MATSTTCTTGSSSGFGLECVNTCGTQSAQWSCGQSGTICGTCLCNNVTALTLPCSNLASSTVTLSRTSTRTSTTALRTTLTSTASRATTTSAAGVLGGPSAAATTSSAAGASLPSSSVGSDGNVDILDSGSSSSGLNMPMVIGAVVGGVLLVACIAGFLLFRRSRKESDLRAGWRSSVRYEDTSYGRHAKKSNGGDSARMIQMAQMYPDEEKKPMPPATAFNTDHYYGANGIHNPVPAYTPASEPVDANAIPFAYAAYSESPVPQATPPQAPAPVASQQAQSQYYYQQNYQETYQQQQQSYDNYASYDYQRDYYTAPPPAAAQAAPPVQEPVYSPPQPAAASPPASYGQQPSLYASSPANTHIQPAVQSYYAPTPATANAQPAAQTIEDIRSRYASVYSVAPGRQ